MGLRVLLIMASNIKVLTTNPTLSGPKAPGFRVLGLRVWGLGFRSLGFFFSGLGFGGQLRQTLNPEPVSEACYAPVNPKP